MKHLNPRQGITTLDVVAADDAPDALRVKHLNPRQGITTPFEITPTALQKNARVKHLNPRQGITTANRPVARETRPRNPV